MYYAYILAYFDIQMKGLFFFIKKKSFKKFIYLFVYFIYFLKNNGFFFNFFIGLIIKKIEKKG